MPAYLPKEIRKAKKYDPLFTRLSETAVKAMSFARISMYYHSLQKKISRAVPWCCDDMCMELWDSPEHEAWHKREHGYVMFVKAVMLSTKKGVVAR